VTSDDDKTPLDQLVDQAADLFVFVPIGLFFEGPSLLPKLAEQGRVHARNARLFGQFAVRHGEDQTLLDVVVSQRNRPAATLEKANTSRCQQAAYSIV